MSLQEQKSSNLSFIKKDTYFDDERNNVKVIRQRAKRAASLQKSLGLRFLADVRMSVTFFYRNRS